jgi:hypothetical protein
VNGNAMWKRDVREMKLSVSEDEIRRRDVEMKCEREM